MGNPWKNRMSKKDFKTFFALAEKLYWQQQKKSGMITPIPYACASDGSERLIAVSMFGIHSDLMKEKLKDLKN